MHVVGGRPLSHDERFPNAQSRAIRPPVRVSALWPVLGASNDSSRLPLHSLKEARQLLPKR